MSGVSMVLSAAIIMVWGGFKGWSPTQAVAAWIIVQVAVYVIVGQATGAWGVTL